MFQHEQPVCMAGRMHKAQDISSGQWIRGWYMEAQDNVSGRICSCIARCEMEDPDKPDVYRIHHIRPDTLCRCSGMEDEAGNMIWEHDIIQRGNGGYGAIMYGEHDGGHYGFYILWNDDWLRKDLSYWHGKVHVVSNMFDHGCSEMRMTENG